MQINYHNMILTDSLLLIYKQYLTDLEYPFIKQKSNIEIKQLFDQEHRIYLLIWILTKLIPSYNTKLDDAKKNNKFDYVLCNILYENGFCRATEKEMFIKDTLDNETQVLIFNRLFHMLSLIYENNSLKENMSEQEHAWKLMFMNTHKDDFKSKIMYEINLAPALGNYNPLSENERNEKLLYFKTEIEKYKTTLEMESSESLDQDRSQTDESSIITNEEIGNVTSKLVDLISQFKTDNFVRAPGDNTITTKVELENFVATSSKNVTKLLQQLEKKQELNTVMNSEEILEEDSTSLAEGDNSGRVLQNFAMAENILQEYKRISEN